jgi:glycosyltransferase involved in cell wall biosynthesis
MIPERSSARAFDGRPEFVLLGLLSLPHNHDAAVTFLDSCMAEVLRVLPEARVHIIGRGAGPGIAAAARPFGDHVVVSGYVPSLTDLFATVCAVLAPLRFGSGIKIKVIEALAHGVPVLGTPCALEGVRTDSNSGVVEVQHVQQFPAQMHRLSRPDVNGRMSSDARRHHVSTYGRAAVFKQYDEIFGMTPDAARMGRLRSSSPPVAR